MLVQIIVFVISGLMFQSKASINPYGPTVIKDCTNCVIHIIKNEFIKPGLLIFANTNNFSTSVLRIRTEILKNIHKKIKFSVEVLSPSKEVEVCDQDLYKLGVLHVDHFVVKQSANYYIIIVDSYMNFSYLASKLIRSRNWNPFAKFIILLFNFDDTEKVHIEHVEKILTCLFKYNAIKIVVVLPQKSNYRTAIIYGWRPYDPPKYCGYFNETAKNRLVEQNVCVHGLVKYDKNVFGNKIPYDMNGCVLNVLALKRQPYISDNEHDANIEKTLINRMLKRFQMTAQYEVINGFRGERQEVGKWNGGLKKLAAKKAHVLLGGVFPDFDVHEDFECSTTYLSDSYVWVVPRAPRLPRWVGLLIIFHAFVWYSAIAGFVICSISWKIIGQICGDSSYNKLFIHCFLNTWISIFGFVAYKRPVKESLRVFFVFLNIYSLLFLTAYQTKLFDVLTNSSYEYQIQTVEELVDSGLKFGGFEEIHDLFYNSTDPFDYYIGKEWITVHNITAAMIDVAIYRNFSVLCSRLELGHLSAVLPELSDSHGRYKYYAFQRDTFTVAIEIVALRGFPFMHKYSNTISLFRQSGLNDELRRKYATFNEIRRAHLLRSLTHKNHVVNSLSIQHLQGGFFVLGFGCFAGTLSLLIEIVINSKYVRRKINQYKKQK